MPTLIAAAVAVLLAATPAAAEDLPIAPSPTPSAAPGVEIPDFATKAWIVVDAGSGAILAGQNIDEQRPMASTLKTLTALTLLPRLQNDSVHEGTARETLTEGMHVGVLAGSKYTVTQLLHGMLMRSGNDAAVALADAYGYQRTLDAMNAEAQRVGATHTVAKSPNGLDQPGQVTTATDLAQIYRVAIQDPRLTQILTTREFEFPAQPPTDPTQSATTFTIYNHDTLLNENYPGFLGGKSGFTSQAGRTYVAGAERNGRRLVVRQYRQSPAHRATSAGPDRRGHHGGAGRIRRRRGRCGPAATGPDDAAAGPTGRRAGHCHVSTGGHQQCRPEHGRAGSDFLGCGGGHERRGSDPTTIRASGP